MCKSASLQNRKTYLSDFLADFGYSAEAKSALEAAFDRIAEEKSASRLFEKIRRRYEKKPDEKFGYLVESADKIAAKCALSPYAVYLVVLILLSESSKKVYADRDVSSEMWRRNMFDLKYECDTCILVRGVYGTDCPLWPKSFFAATRFTFGKLQFETGRLGKPYEKDGIRLRPDDRVIFIHIPRTGERLLPEDVDAATQAASRFFKERYGIEDVIFACHSWLLYPENKNILSETSNLYSFISRFEIIHVEEDTTYKDLWRLFDMEYKGDADALPRDTSLRRAYAERVKAHKPLGAALGVWVYKK
ncbi:MAG: hypothetical protein J6Y74_03690 [Clostridia bacterium]|nr:hypothetical protein [Clostridia bacterium]